MLSKSLLLLALTGATFASPQPQNVADIVSSALGSIPTDIDLGSISSEFGAATSLLGALSDLPTLPASIQSVLATAIPASDLTRTDLACDPTAADWYKNLPNDVKSALTSYGSAIQTWASEHISELGSYTNINIPVCTGTTAGAGASKSATTTASGSKATGASTSAAGGATAASGGASSSTSKGAAPRVTGAIMGSAAGIIGALGVIAML